MFTNEKKAELVAKLDERFNKFSQQLKCPMCGNSQFTLADAYLRHDLQNELNSMSLGGPSIPSIAIICNNCGFISQHAIGILGLLPKEESKDGKE
jgi:hypothetical protein